MYGGSIAVILINTPGAPAAIATTFDGYPMAATGSAIGGMPGTLALRFFAPLLAMVPLQFGSPEYFWLGVLGPTIIASLSPGSLAKGLFGGLFGILISTVGLSLSNVQPNMVVPGGQAPVVGNNPVAIAVPIHADFPFALDIALSQVAAGKLLLAAKKGEKIPLDWAADREGRPTDDPQKGFDGYLLPMGGFRPALQLNSRGPKYWTTRITAIRKRDLRIHPL